MDGYAMEGVELSARFALPPNSFSYCGTPIFRRAFAAYLKKKSPANARALEEALSKFKAHYSYLKLIADANGMRPFDRKVAEALWIGNPCLGKVKKHDIAKLMMGEFSGKGLLTGKKAAKLAAGIPVGALPHHSFHVMYVHTITGVVPPSLKTADLCRISWGKVVGVKNGKIEFDSQKLARKKGKAAIGAQKAAGERGKLCLVPCRKKIRAVCAGIGFVPKIMEGDIVASHWGFAVMKLTESQAARLEKYTRKNLSALAGE